MRGVSVEEGKIKFIIYDRDCRLAGDLPSTTFPPKGPRPDLEDIGFKLPQAARTKSILLLPELRIKPRDIISE
jgi:hypothetical protein